MIGFMPLGELIGALVVRAPGFSSAQIASLQPVVVPDSSQVWFVLLCFFLGLLLCFRVLVRRRRARCMCSGLQERFRVHSGLSRQVDPKSMAKHIDDTVRSKRDAGNMHFAPCNFDKAHARRGSV